MFGLVQRHRTERRLTVYGRTTYADCHVSGVEYEARRSRQYACARSSAWLQCLHAPVRQSYGVTRPSASDASDASPRQGTDAIAADAQLGKASPGGLGGGIQK